MAVTLLFAAAGPSYADKPGTPVEVVNGPTNPVPVQVVSLPGSTNAVQVVNTTNAPLLVRNVDQTARTFFQTNVAWFPGGGGPGTAFADILNVPAGSRAVIETVTVRASLPTAYLPDARISTTVGARETAHFLTLTSQSTQSGYDTLGGSFAIRLYADPSTTVRGFFTAAPMTQMSMSISGYFEAAP
jgi:hypothetical protein